MRKFELTEGDNDHHADDELPDRDRMGSVVGLCVSAFSGALMATFLSGWFFFCILLLIAVVGFGYLGWWARGLK